jgi:hypothetical protein
MFAHIPLALLIQSICWAIGNKLHAPTRAGVWIGCFAASAACIVREITQHEYRWIEAYGRGLRANMPFYEGLKFWDWNAHSIQETIVAILAAMIFALVAGRFAKGRT